MFSDFQDYRHSADLIQKEATIINSKINAINRKIALPNSFEIEFEIMGEFNLFDAHDNLKALCLSFKEDMTSAHLISLLAR